MQPCTFGQASPNARFAMCWQCPGRFVGNPMGIVRSFSGISGGFRCLRIEWPKLCETFGNQCLDFIQFGVKRPRFRVIECFKLGQF